jgi:metal-responsive CopG/Arc/MetJ family transcriptional regulator
MKTISLKLSGRLNTKLDRAAKQRGQSKSEIIRIALEHFLNGAQPGQRPLSALELAGDLVGCADGPPDLATNPKYMEGFGE